jgi:4-hydroxybenzoate polyprenyltransferase
MHGLLAFIRMFRLPNLVIVLLTQAMPYWFVLRPAILEAGGIPVVTERIFALIAAATILTTLAGYILNDYYDRSMDAMNKPRRVVWGRYLPANSALFMYASVVVAAHTMAFFVERELRPTNHWPLWVFPSVSFLLFLYAWQMKCSAVIGNILVSVLCGFVPIIMLLPEERPLWLTSFIDPDHIHRATGSVWIYAIFAFITNLLREQIKDLEDFQGDAACGCMTLAVSKGPRYAKKPAGFTGLAVSVLIGLLLFFWQQTGVADWQLALGVVLLLIPALAATFMVFRAKGRRDFTWASAMVKLVMFSGLFLLVRWPNV